MALEGGGVAAGLRFSLQDTSEAPATMSRIPHQRNGETSSWLRYLAAKAVNTFRALPFAKTISAFLMPKTYETLLDRMGSHGLSDTDRTTRLAEARGSIETSLKDFKETKLTHFILNDSLELALQQIRALTTEDSTDTNRESEARSAAQLMLHELPQAV